MKFVARDKISKSNPSSAQHVVLSTDECRRARTFWLRRIQLDLFPEEMTALANQKPIAPKSSILSLSLNPFLDTEGLIRVGGRLRNVPIPVQAKHPIVLASHPLVTLTVR